MQSVKIHFTHRKAHIYRPNRAICALINIPKILKNTRLFYFVEGYLLITVLSNLSQIFNDHDCTRYSILAQSRRIK